jgi:hypothetical protein
VVETPPSGYVRSAVLDLMRLPNKAAVQKYCREVTITGSDFANVLLNARIGALAPYQYVNHYDERRPSHLDPTDEELRAVADNGVGPARGKARKFLRKINQASEDRRLFTAHLIHHPDTPEWHLFYFDQRDMQRFDNHWKKGRSHIHYSRHDIANALARDIWAGVLASPPELPKSEHVRYSHSD